MREDRAQKADAFVDVPGKQELQCGVSLEHQRAFLGSDTGAGQEGACCVCAVPGLSQRFSLPNPDLEVVRAAACGEREELRGLIERERPGGPLSG